MQTSSCAAYCVLCFSLALSRSLVLPSVHASMYLRNLRQLPSCALAGDILMLSARAELRCPASLCVLELELHQWVWSIVSDNF